MQKTIIRSCDSLNRLLEMNLYIEVISNTYPDFVSEPETAFTVAVSDVYQYQLPEVVDPEGNDEPEVYVGILEQQEENYPPFLLFDSDTRTITLKPDSNNYAGRTYYFTIVVKEKNSDSVKYSFYATVRVESDIVEPDWPWDEDHEKDGEEGKDGEDGEGGKDGKDGEDGEGRKKAQDLLDHFKDLFMGDDGAMAFPTTITAASIACLLAISA